ncbi:MAG: aminotransferase class V-fold PLP-dependent enzyme [Bacteroidota bacterium]
MRKREFLKRASLMSFAMPFSLSSIQHLFQSVDGLPASQVATDEDFWARIRAGYRLKPDYINLENGYYCMLPEETLDAYIELIREVNYHASWYMRTEQWDNKKAMTAKLEAVAGVNPGEVAITRNTTESLDLVIAGMPWEAGDEAVMAEQDYGAMLNQFKLMEKRYGIRRKVVSLPNHPKDDEEIVDLYASAITDKTRLLMVCHMVNITGQVLPIRKICDMAHERGVEVMVDGAHAFAHIDFKIPDLNCDYYGTSLHKWLSVPLGAGLLYVHPSKVDNVWPLFAEDESADGSILRLNHTGTHPVATDLAIESAIDYHQAIGIERKQERLNYLQHYWTSRVRDLPGVIVNTPADRSRHGGIGNVGIEGMEPADFAKRLLDDHKIWTVAINRPGVRGLRITPNVYTTTDELDALIRAIGELSS